jgi:uncharacterized protein
MALAELLDNDFKSALKSKNEKLLSILRLVRSAIKNIEIEKHGPASDEDIIEILQREIKQHKETIEALKLAGRNESIALQEQEISVLSSYLPAQLSSSEIREVIEKVIQETQAESISDVGKVMGAIMPQVKGRATGDEVGRMVRDILVK